MFRNDPWFSFEAPSAESPDEARLILRAALTKPELMSAFAAGLQFPAHFGKNWDALYDCLTDLAWLACGRVCIAHEGLPDLDERDQRIYVRVLRDSVVAWQNREPKRLRVTFAPELREPLVGKEPFRSFFDIPAS